MEINKILSLSKGDFGLNQVANLSPSEIATLVSQYSKLGSPDDLEEDERRKWEIMIKSNSVNVVTYSELKTKISESKLNPGAFYIISDYSTKLKSVEYNEIKLNPISFKVMVQALSTNRISKSAKVVDGPAGSEGWKVMYDIDPQTCDWAADDSTGVIYWMRDEGGNEAPFDFKSILFKRYRVNKGTPHSKLLGVELGKPIHSACDCDPTDILSGRMCGTSYVPKYYNRTSSGEYIRTKSVSLRLSNESEYFSAIGPESVGCKIVQTVEESTRVRTLPNIVIGKGINSTVSGDRSTYKYIINCNLCLTDSYVGVCLSNSIAQDSNLVSIVSYDSEDAEMPSERNKFDGLTIGSNCSFINILYKKRDREGSPMIPKISIGYECNNIFIGPEVNRVNIGSSCLRIAATYRSSGINIGSKCVNISTVSSRSIDIGSESAQIATWDAKYIQIGNGSRLIYLGNLGHSRFGCGCDAVMVNFEHGSLSNPIYAPNRNPSDGIEVMSNVHEIEILGDGGYGLCDILIGPGVRNKVINKSNVQRQYWS